MVTAAASAQRSVLSALPGVRNVKDFSLCKAFAATVSSVRLAALAANPAVAEVIPDEAVALWPADSAFRNTKADQDAKAEKSVGPGRLGVTGSTAQGRSVFRARRPTPAPTGNRGCRT